MKNTPFYACGLKFSCKRCSSCCRHDPGFVFLSEKDLKKLVSGLKMDRKSFLEKYCRWVTDWKGDEVLSLIEKFNRDCIFWENGCTVYDVRPLQCITFPFWDSIVNSEKAWEIAAGGCPGINTGEFHTAETIEDDIKLRALQPIINRIQEVKL